MSDDDDDVVQPETVQREETISDITFVPDDTTTEVKWPPRRVFVMPAGLSDDAFEERARAAMRFFTLPHPRTGGNHLMCLCPTSATGTTLCMVQEHRATDYHFWFIGDHVEPNGSLYVATPFDLCYLAVWILLNQTDKAVDATTWAKLLNDPTSKPPFTFADVETMTFVDPRLRLLHEHGLLPQLTAAMRLVADEQQVGEDSYFRFSMAKTADLVKARFDRLVASPAVRQIVYPAARDENRRTAPAVETKKNAKAARQRSASIGADDRLEQAHRSQPSAEPMTPLQDPLGSSELSTTPEAATKENDGDQPTPPENAAKTASDAVAWPSADLFLPLRSLHLILDFVPKPLHAVLAKHCGVDTLDAAETRALATRHAANSLLSAEDDAVFNNGTPGQDLKRHRTEGSGSLTANAKSQSVKKLEKNGPPKGTPSLMSMFATKKTPTK
jgi:hypothetical protein